MGVFLFVHKRVTINLKDRGMHSGTKYYKRLKHCLQKLETCDIIIKWTPPSENVCPSSLAKYFHDKNIGVQVCSPAIKTMSRTMPSVPILNNDNIEEVTEWCGMLALGGDVKPEVDYVSQYVVPDESTKCGPVSVMNVSGFFTYQAVNELYEALKLLAAGSNATQSLARYKPWVDITRHISPLMPHNPRRLTKLDLVLDYQFCRNYPGEMSPNMICPQFNLKVLLSSESIIRLARREYIATRELRRWTSLSLQTFRDGFCNGKSNSNMSYLPMDCIKTIFVQQESDFIHTTTCQI